MLPAVWPGDVLEVRRQEAAEVQPGDVVLYWRQGRLVAHRVVEKLSRQGGILLITQGDRMRQPDSPLAPPEVLGRVVEVTRGPRRVSPRLTFWRKIAAAILSRSELCTRLVLRLQLETRNRSHRYRKDPCQALSY
jgi:signal peptidase I